MNDRTFEVIIVAYTNRRAVPEAIMQLGKLLPVCVVDNAAPKEAPQWANGVRYLPQAGNLGFGAAAHLAIKSSAADVVLLLNPDCRIAPQDAASLCSRVAASDLCAVGPVFVADRHGPLLSGAGGFGPSLARCLQYVGGLSLMHRSLGLATKGARNRDTRVAWVAGTCMALDRTLYLRVGGFSPEFFLYSEDVDLGLRMGQAGGLMSIDGRIEAIHDQGSSTHCREDAERLRAQSMLKLISKHTRSRWLASAKLCAIYCGAFWRHRLGAAFGREYESVHYVHELRSQLGPR